MTEEEQLDTLCDYINSLQDSYDKLGIPPEDRDLALAWFMMRYDKRPKVTVKFTKEEVKESTLREPGDSYHNDWIDSPG